jgi:hypothetical protein
MRSQTVNRQAQRRSEKHHEWKAISEWACRHVGIEATVSESSYPSIFKNGARIGDTCATTGMWYRIPERGYNSWADRRTVNPGKLRCYVYYRGETLEQVQETFAYLMMAHDNLMFVLLRAKSHCH